MKKKFRELTEYPLVIIFAIFIVAFFACYLFVPSKEKSEWENRYLAKRPELSLADVADGSFMQKFESYTNDQIAGRDLFIKIKAVCEMSLLKNCNNGIVRGKESNLYTEDISDASLFIKNKDVIKKFIEQTDKTVTVAIAPNACEVNKELIPVGMPCPDQASFISNFNQEISLLKNTHVVDLVEALSGHGEEYLYYRTDHHWTTIGAYLAYREISNNPIEISTLNENKIENFYGTLYAKYKGLSIKPDVISYYDIPIKEAVFGDVKTDTLYDLSKADVFDKYGLFLYGNSGYSNIKTKCENGKSLIVFKDSYANSVIPFLTFDYSDITIIDLRYYGESVKELISEDNNSDILILYNFDFLNEDKHMYKLLK